MVFGIILYHCCQRRTLVPSQFKIKHFYWGKGCNLTAPTQIGAVRSPMWDSMCSCISEYKNARCQQSHIATCNIRGTGEDPMMGHHPSPCSAQTEHSLQNGAIKKQICAQNLWRNNPFGQKITGWTHQPVPTPFCLEHGQTLSALRCRISGLCVGCAVPVIVWAYSLCVDVGVVEHVIVSLGIKLRVSDHAGSQIEFLVLTMTQPALLTPDTKTPRLGHDTLLGTKPSGGLWDMRCMWSADCSGAKLSFVLCFLCRLDSFKSND